MPSQVQRENSVSLKCLLVLPRRSSGSTVNFSGVRTFIHFSFYWVDIMIGFTSKINSLGTNERLFYFSFNCKFKSLKWSWQITHIAGSTVAERQDFQKFLKIQVIPGINPKFNLLSLVSLLEHFFFFLPKSKGGKRRNQSQILLTPVLLSLCHRGSAVVCPWPTALNTARGSWASMWFPGS